MNDLARLPSTAAAERFDVLVVGAGPAGLSTGIALRRAGVRVLVIDKHAGTSIFPKATGLRTRGLEILRSWGLEEPLRRREFPLHPSLSFSRSLAEPAYEVRSWLPQAETTAASSPVSHSSVAQDQLEAVLLEHLVDLGGEVRFGTELVDVVDDGTQVTARLLDRVTDRTDRVVAAYLVAADGAASPIRERLGIDWISYGSRGAQVAALVQLDLTGRVPGGLALGHAISDSAGDALFFPSGPRRWVFNLALSNVDGPSPATWTPTQWRQRLRLAAGVPDADVAVQRIFEWDFGAAAAAALSSGRVFLVGDAAHRSTPAGGTGTSVAIADAHNLAWKLAFVIRGWADESLLDTYQAERGPVAHRAVRRSMEAEVDPTQRLADDVAAVYRSAALAGSGPLEAEPNLAVLDGRPGARAPHVWITRRGRRLSTLDLFEGRLTVLAGPDADWARSGAGRLRAELAPVRTVTAGRDIRDPGGDLLDRFGLSTSGAVLVRPDGYVVWRAPAGGFGARERLIGAARASLGISYTRELLAVA